jgi:hypothetical protein
MPDLQAHHFKEMKVLHCSAGACRYLTPSRAFTVLLMLMTLLLWIGASMAQAADLVPGPGEVAPQPEGNVITGITLGVAIVSFLTTGLGYLLNYALPFVRSEQSKGVMQWVYQAIAVVLYQLAFGDGFGFNTETYVAFAEAIAVYGLSHNFLYKPPGWNTTLRAGQNRQDVRRGQSR